jgi:hypothetical protein
MGSQDFNPVQAEKADEKGDRTEKRLAHRRQPNAFPSRPAAYVRRAVRV